MDAAHRQLAGASSGSGGGQTDTEPAVLLNNLLPALLQTFAVVLLGYVSARWRLLPAGSDTVLGAYTATFALPALIFQNMASLNLGQASVGLLLGVLAAKSAVAIVVALFTLILVGTGGGGGSGGAQHTWSLAALFAMATTQQNDFALGLPVLDALYPPKVLPPECGLDPVPVVWLAQQAAGVCTPQLQMSDYLYLFAPISLLVINPICFAVLELANALTRRRAQQRSGNGGSGGGGGGGSICSCRFLLRQVLLPTLTNPVGFCVALGVIANVTHLPLPSFATDALRTVGSSFSSLALFCLGMSLGLKSEPAEASAVGDQLEGDEPDAGRGGADSAPLSQLAAAPQNETHALDGCVQPLLLVAAKSLLLPIVARFVVYAITHSEFVARFAFVYCTFPAAPSVYLFAVRYGMPAPDLKRLSFTTVA
jgi:predicted permease